MTDTPKKVPLHLASWAAQDWLTSRVRMRSIQTNDPWLRVIYREALDSLQEAGGVLAHDIEALADKLGAPAKEVERCLAILDKIARTPGCRGGLIVEDGTVRNLRISQTFEQAAAYARQQAEFGKKGGKGRSKPRGSKGASGNPKGTPGVPKGLPNHPYPYPLPSPLPLSVAVSGSVAVPVPVADSGRSGVAGEGVGGERPPAPPAVASGEPAQHSNNGNATDTDLRTAISHDPNNELHVAIVDRMVHLAKVDAWKENRQASPADVLAMLHDVSSTPAGKYLDSLMHASRSWLEQTLRASEVFEREISDPESEGDDAGDDRAPP